MIKIPPHSLEAEQSVLGSLLIDKEGFLVIGDLLTPEDFYDEANKYIYDAMLELYKHNRPIDIITVKDKLDSKKLLDKV
jgi:replicative DNA helicase